MNTLTKLLCASALLLGCGLASAREVAYAPGGPGMQEQILHGLRTGRLSAREATQLEREQDHLARLSAQAFRDGRVNGPEGARLERARQQARWNIERQLRDREFGDPRSVESRRMQQYVEQRIAQERWAR